MKLYGALHRLVQGVFKERFFCINNSDYLQKWKYGHFWNIRMISVSLSGLALTRYINRPTAQIVTHRKLNTTPQTAAFSFPLWGDQDAAFLRPKPERRRPPALLPAAGPRRSCPGGARRRSFDSGEAGASPEAAAPAVLPPHWKYPVLHCV